MNRNAVRLRAWLGVNGPAIDDSDADVADAFVIATMLGCSAVRLDLDWPTLARPDSPRHARARALVRAARDHGLSVLACVGYSPDDVELVDPAAAGNPWQRTPTGQGAVRVRDLDLTFADLIRDGVRAFEGWNEWNSPAFSHPPDAAAMALYHAALADAVSTAVWLTGRAVPLVVGGTAPNAYQAHDAYEDMLGVRDVYAAIGRVGDYPAHHPYAFGYDPYAEEHRAESYNALLVQSLAVGWVWAAHHRGRGARVWATEIGWPDSMGDVRARARRATADLTWWAEQARAGITGPVFVYTARSDRLTGVDGEAFGLRDRDGVPKQALIDAIRAAGAVKVGTTGAAAAL